VEDLAGTSFAGQYRSVLEVGPQEAVAAVRRVWASLWHPAPCAYRRAHGVADEDAAMAVLLMAMVAPVQAGVVFTTDPADPGCVRVEAVEGLGEALVSGAVTPRSWSLARVDAGDEPAPVGPAARLALAVEGAFGRPVDVEWAWDGSTVWLLQARPITTVAGGDGFDTPIDDHHLTTAGIAEMLPGVLPPLVWQLAATAVEEALRRSLDDLAVLDPDLRPPHVLVRRVRGRAALDLDVLSAAVARLPGNPAHALEHGFFGTDAGPAGARPNRWRALLHDLRVDQARRRAQQEARVAVRAAERLASTPGVELGSLDDRALLRRRRQLVDLGLRAMAAEVAVAAAAAAAYERLEHLIARHLPAEEAGRWTRRVTTGITRSPTPTVASMSVFAGTTWDEAGIEPPPAGPSTAGRGQGSDLAELEAALRALPRWQTTRLLTGQVVDVRAHVVRRLTAEAAALLSWREQAKAAVLTVGGLVRAIHLELGRRLADRGLLPDPEAVDLLTDEELRGVAPVPPPAVLGRRRRALQVMEGAGSLPERFVGRPPARPAPLPAGDRLSGLPASGGRCTGRAQVVRDPRHERLEPGAVLVAESTDAGWSPLFVEAGAVVVERGGPLSHAAIVARELGVPAVLDVHGATQALDGCLVTVDGDTGVIVVHREQDR
jgi:pyruvate,water dikinase